MKKLEKNHDTGLRILEVLKILMSESLTKQELIEKLEVTSSVGQVYSQEAILKYFNTLEVLGFKLKKEKHKYSIERALYRIDLSKKEIKILINLIKNIHKLNNRSEEDKVKKIISNISKYIDIDVSEILNEITDNEKTLYNINVKENVILTLKQLIYDNQVVEITYKKNNREEKMTVVVKEIIEKKGKVFVVCYNSKLAANKKIPVEIITSIKQLPNKVSEVLFLNSVVFEVYGRLASVYKLKPSERVLDFSNNHLTISNTEEDKESLLLRLLKYGENCKIIRPKSMQEDFLLLTNDILANLEVS